MWLLLLWGWADYLGGRTLTGWLYRRFRMLPPRVGD
jgi:hypothetical protein